MVSQRGKFQTNHSEAPVDSSLSTDYLKGFLRKVLQKFCETFAVICKSVSGKRAEILWKVRRNFLEISAKFSAMTTSQTTPKANY